MRPSYNAAPAPIPDPVIALAYSAKRPADQPARRFAAEKKSNLSALRHAAGTQHDDGKAIITPTSTRAETFETSPSFDRPAVTIATVGAPVAEQTNGVAHEQLLPPREHPATHGAIAATKNQFIDFKTALRMAAGNNPRVAIAAARIDASFARWQAANVLWLPSLRMGVSVNKHEGTIQEVTGPVFDVSRTSLNGGVGTFAIGAGSPAVPGVFARFHSADAVFQPRIEAASLAASHSASHVVNNDLLLETALTYLDLLDAMQQKIIAQQTLHNTATLARITSDFAETGQGPQADADRAKVALVLRQNDIIRATEAAGVASAKLAELLRLPCTCPLLPAEPAVTEIDLVSPDTCVQNLVAAGLGQRPELAQSRSLVGQAIERLKKEKYAPYLPSVVLGMSYSGFGGSEGSSIDNFRDRLDFDAVAYWELRNLGFGESAARYRASAKVNESKMRELLLMDKVASEIAQAHAQVIARRHRIATARGGITAAETSYQHNLERIRNGKGLPIELLQSIQALDQVRQEYLRSLIAYNKAQFQLYRAIGWPINCD